MGYAINTDFFSGTGNLNTTWWSTYTGYLTATMQRNSLSIGTPNAGACTCVYKYSKCADDQSITITGINNLSSGLVYCYLRTNDSAQSSQSAFLGQLFYSSGSIQYVARELDSGVEGTTIIDTTTGTFSNSDTTKYKFSVTGTPGGTSTIKWFKDGTEIGSGTSTKSYTGTPAFGIYDGTGSYTVNSKSLTIDGALASVGNLLTFR